MVDALGSYTGGISGPVLPDRRIYRAADRAYDWAPYGYAASTALFTPGTRMDKLNAGSDSLAYWLGYRAALKKFNHWLDGQYAKHPALAEQANRHPLLVGLPMSMAGMVASGMVALLGQRGWQWLRSRSGFSNTMESVAYSGVGDAAARSLAPVERFASRPGVRTALGLGTLAFSGAVLLFWLKDSWQSGRSYKTAREILPQSSPYTARQLASAIQVRPNLASTLPQNGLGV